MNTEDVGVVTVISAFALVRFKYSKSCEPSMTVVETAQSSVSSLFLNIENSGALDNPCPTVLVEPSPV